MVGELQRLHAELSAQLDALDALIAQPEPPMEKLPGVRLALTRASRARTIFLTRLYGQLIARAPSSQKAALEALRAEANGQMLASAEHIGSWTLNEIAARWPEYRAASDKMRAAMRQRIKREAQLVYPLLADKDAALVA